MASAGTNVAGQAGVAGGVPRAPQVAETPLEGRGRQGRHEGGRGRDESRNRRDGSRGRSLARRREHSYDPRGASCSTNRSRSASAFRDRNTDELLDDRLYSLSRILVKLCRHDGTDYGLVPSTAGWFPFGNVLAVANELCTARSKGQKSKGKGKGKGCGGGNAPGPAPLNEADVIEIVERAKRAHLGLVENHDGRIICTRAWGYHAGLRDRQVLAEYDFYSASIPRTRHPNVTRVAFVTAKTEEYGEVLRNGIRGHQPRRDDRARARR
jgi:hypothetical protein